MVEDWTSCCMLSCYKFVKSMTINFPLDKRGSDATKVSEPFLKITEFQGVCGTSKYIGPEIVVTGLPKEREIPRAAIVFENKIGGGKFGDVSLMIAQSDRECSGLVPNFWNFSFSKFQIVYFYEGYNFNVFVSRCLLARSFAPMH